MKQTESPAIRAIQEIKKAVIGKDDCIIKVMTAILAGGHILIEDVPGVGKTTLALAFSKALHLEQNRIQFTPDVLPGDVTGFSLYQKATGTFEYQPGAVMCNLLLADEINRTSPKTQAALLEVMEEGKVTVDQITHELPKPFVVIATQNPVGSAGTSMLPQSQLDRFMICMHIGYPDMKYELEIVKGKITTDPLDLVEPVMKKTFPDRAWNQPKRNDCTGKDGTGTGISAGEKLCTSGGCGGCFYRCGSTPYPAEWKSTCKQSNR